MTPSSTRSYPSLHDYQQFFDRLTTAAPATPDAGPGSSQENVFQQTLIALLPTVPAGADQLMMLLLKAVSGFQAMKKGQLDEGFARLEPVLAAIPTLPTDANALAETLVSPMVSFYYYRKGQFDTARHYADRSIALSDHWQHRYTVLHMHRIQQLFNLSRIDLAEGRYELGLDTIRQLINYLATGQLPTLPGHWHEPMLRQLPTQLLSVQFMEIVNELTFLALKRPDLEPTILNDILTDVSLSLTNTLPAAPSPYSALLDWAEAKRDLAAHRYRDFLLQTAYFLGQYPSAYDQMKLSLVRDLNQLLFRADASVQAFRPRLGQYINGQLRLPARLIAHLRASRAVATA